MTYKDIKILTDALLVGDTQVPSDDSSFMMLLRYSFERISNYADAMKLFTSKDSGDKIVRNGPAGSFIRYPDIPENINDELDLDEELCFACAELICSMLTKEKQGLHYSRAMNIIAQYNQKVTAYIENELSENGNTK